MPTQHYQGTKITLCVNTEKTKDNEKGRKDNITPSIIQVYSSIATSLFACTGRNITKTKLIIKEFSVQENFAEKMANQQPKRHERSGTMTGGMANPFVSKQ